MHVKRGPQKAWPREFCQKTAWIRESKVLWGPQTGLPTEYFALCSEHFEALCFSRSVLIGTPVDFKGFYCEKVSVQQYRRSRKIHWTLITQEMREDLQIDFSWETFRTPPPPPPPKQKIDLFSDWVGLFEVCFRSSEMTDPRPCPREWAFLESLRVQRRHAKLEPTKNYQLYKNQYFGGEVGVRETWQDKTPPPQTSIGRF